MVDQKLLDYIRQSLFAGQSMDQIRSNLLASGWPETQVNEAINEVFPTDEASKKKETKEDKKHSDSTSFVAGLILLFVALWVLGWISSLSDEPTTVASNSEVTELTSPNREDSKKESTSQHSVADIKASSVVVSYDDLMRNNKAHIGKIVRFEGEIIQLTESSIFTDDEFNLRVATKEGAFGSYSEDIIWVWYKGSRLLEGDVIELWAEVEGLETYLAVLGNSVTIPKLKALYIVLKKKAGEKSNSGGIWKRRFRTN